MIYKQYFMYITIAYSQIICYYFLFKIDNDYYFLTDYYIFTY